MKKNLRKQTLKVGQKLFDVLEMITDLEHEIDYGPELKTKELNDLIGLGNVKALVEVASNMYPYYEE